MKIEAWFDGACGPENPGGTASYGAFALVDGKRVWECSEVMPASACPRGTSNNLAEYAGLLAVLSWLLDAGYRYEPAVIRGDSKLVIQQCSGRWRVKKGIYKDLALRCVAILSQFPNVRLEWVPRECNVQADALSKRCLLATA